MNRHAQPIVECVARYSLDPPCKQILSLHLCFGSRSGRLLDAVLTSYSIRSSPGLRPTQVNQLLSALELRKSFSFSAVTLPKFPLGTKKKIILLLYLLYQTIFNLLILPNLSTRYIGSEVFKDGRASNPYRMQLPQTLENRPLLNFQLNSSQPIGRTRCFYSGNPATASVGQIQKSCPGNYNGR